MQQKIVILGTGGTIAGQATDPARPGQYQAAQLAVAALVAAIPGLAQAAQGAALEARQVAQVDSKDMDETVWLALLHACDKALRDAAVAGVVITHGTDTLEETAWLLHLCLGALAQRAGKAVVLTCAMRPANALLADGPKNLLDAVTLASARAPGGGVVGRALMPAVVAVVGDGVVCGAAQVQKTHPYRLLAFANGDQSPLGWVEDGGVRLAAGVDAARLAPGRAAQLPGADARWPWVEIVTSHAGARAAQVDALVAAGVQGLVLAGTGNGTLHHALEAACLRAAAGGVAVWRSTRCAGGAVEGSQWLPPLALADGRLPGVASSPVKARITLQLALMGLLG